MIQPISRELSELVRPPRRIPVSESARQHLRVATASNVWQPWSLDTAPYMLEPMDLLTSRRHEALVFAAPARTGKTSALLDAWITHAVICDPGDMLAVFPTQLLAQDYSKRRIARLHQHSPELGVRLSPRAYDDNLLTKIYRHGMILSLAWPTSSQLAQRDIRYVVLSDLDSMPDDVDGEGEPFALAKKRTETFLSAGMTVAESSPKRPQIDPRWVPKTPHEAPPTDGGILALYNRGDRRRWYWTCLHCAEPFEAPALPQFRDDPNVRRAADSAYVSCPQCGGIHWPTDKRRLNLAGRWQIDPEQGANNIASFWLLGCAAAFQPWSGLVSNYLRAQREYDKSGNEEGLKSTTNLDQGLPYLPASLRHSKSVIDLLHRAESYDRAIVPEGGRFLVATVDVQSRRFVVQVHAVGVGEIWIIDRYDVALSERMAPGGEPELIAPASHPEDWRLLIPRVLEKTYPLADDSGRYLPIRVLGIDSGGQEGVTVRAYEFWRSARRSGLGARILLLKGDHGDSQKTPRIAETRPDSSHRKDRHAGARGEVPVYLLNTLLLKDDLDGLLRRDPPAIHYAEWLGEAAIGELGAEIRTAKGWVKSTGKARNETWDLLVYCRAIAIRLGIETWGDQWERCRDWARAWDSNPMIIKKTPENPVMPAITTESAPKHMESRHNALLERLRNR